MSYETLRKPSHPNFTWAKSESGSVLDHLFKFTQVQSEIVWFKHWSWILPCTQMNKCDYTPIRCSNFKTSSLTKKKERSL